MNSLGFISSLNSLSMNKHEICVEIKNTKKTYVSVKRETELLNLIHTDLGYLKQTMIRGGKKYLIHTDLYIFC